MHFVLLDRSNAKGIDTIGLVAGVGCIPTLAVDILRAEGPVVLGIFARKGVAILLANAGTTTSPSESTNAHTLNGHYPHSTNDVLAVVLILLVDALTIESTYLIVQQVAALGVLEEVTLNLHTDVTTIRGITATTIRETSQLAHVLRVAHESLRNRVHGVLECEGTLELTCLHLEELVLLPLTKEVNQTNVG